MNCKVPCPHCGAVLLLAENHLGKTIRCAGCRQCFTAPAVPVAEILEDMGPTSPGPVAALPLRRDRERPEPAPVRRRPPIRKNTRGGRLVALIVGSVAGCFLLIFVGVLLMWLFRTEPNNHPEGPGAPQGVAELPPQGKEPDLPAAGSGPLEGIKPPAAKQEVALSGPVADVAVGGGGRYLILYLADRRKLAVFDVRQGKLAKELPVADDVLHYAAGANRLVVVYPNSKLVQIWDLTTFAKERSAPLPEALKNDDIHQVCMGSASAGPLFVYLPREKRTLALALTDLQTTEVRWTHWSPTNAYGPLHMRASPDGTVLLGWSGGWAGMAMATFRDGQQVDVQDKFEFSMGVFALPSADGRFIFTPWAIVSRDLSAAKVPELKNAYLVPAHEPGYFLALHTAGNGGLPNSPYGKGASPNLPAVREVAVYSDDRKRLFALPDCDELKPGSAVYWEKRVHYYPRVGLLVTLADKNRLILRRVDLIKQLNRSGADYLLVISRPPAVRPGTLFAYRLDVRSKQGGVKVQLESGPDGMKVTPDGRVTWAVPADFGPAEAEVVLTLSDASGQEVLHTFRIAPADR